MKSQELTVFGSLLNRNLLSILYEPRWFEEMKSFLPHSAHFSTNHVNMRSGGGQISQSSVSMTRVFRKHSFHAPRLWRCEQSDWIVNEKKDGGYSERLSKSVIVRTRSTPKLDATMNPVFPLRDIRQHASKIRTALRSKPNFNNGKDKRSSQRIQVMSEKDL